MYWSNSSSSEERLVASEIGSSVHRVTGSSEEQLPASSSWLLEERLLASSCWLLVRAGLSKLVSSPAGVTVLQAASLLAISAFRKRCQADWKSSSHSTR